MMRKYLIALASVMVGTSFAQVPMPAQTVPSAPVQVAPPPTQTPSAGTPPSPTQPPPSNPVQTPTSQPQQPQPIQPPTPAIPPPSQPLTPQEMQQLNQLVPPITGPSSNTPSSMPPTSGLPNLPGSPGSVMSKRDRVKNYEVLQRVGHIYVVSSPDNHTYVLRSDSQILRRYRCHIVYPYTYCAKEHKKTHKPKHGLY